MEYDAIIIGGGPGGTKAARILSKAGKQVLLVSDNLGGECLNFGCIPTKAYLWTAELLKKIKMAEGIGLRVSDVQVDFEKMRTRKNEVVAKLKKNLRFTVERSGAQIAEGRATLHDAHTVSLQLANGETKNVTADYIILATGSLPRFPKDLPKSDRIISNAELLDLPEIPKTLLIIGAGAVGVEFCSLFAALGTQVTLVESAGCLLPREDADLCAELEKVFTREHITILNNTHITAAETEEYEKVLMAVGRVANTQGLGLEKAGVVLQENGSPQINDWYQTTQSNIFAIGDLAGRAQLAYSAEREAEIAVGLILNKNSSTKAPPAALRYETIPNTIFSMPEVGSVGVSEQEAKKRGIAYRVGKSSYSANAKALIMGERDGFAKILVEEKTEKLLGVHLIGEKATELIAEASLGLSANLTLTQFAQNLHSHPVLAEVIKEACEALY